MLLTPEIQDLIVGRRSAQEIRDVARKQGMRSLRENALYLATQGLTTLDEVLTVTVDETPKFMTPSEGEEPEYAVHDRKEITARGLRRI